MSHGDDESTTYPDANAKRTFGIQLDAAMRELDLSNEELGKMCGVGPNVVSTWRNGHRVPKGRVPWLLCQAIGFERWMGLWGGVDHMPVQGGRLWTDRDVNERARELAAKILADNLRQLRNGDAK